MTAPYVPFYPSDWLAGTRGLTAEETGIYITLIAMMYEREAPIDMPEDRLARLCGCGVKAFRRAVDGLLAERKLVLTDAGLWNERAEKEIEKRSARTESARSSVAHRWKKSEQKQGSSDTNVLRTEYVGDTNQNHNQNHISKNTPLPPKGGYDEGFEAFWEIYPRKVGKGQAAKAFTRKVKQFGIDAVMDGLRRHLPGLNAQNKGPGQDYRPHPATWLNGDRFNDPVAGYTPSLLERMANGANDLGSTGALDWRGTGYLPAPIRNTQSSD